jgi:hypothetical protein
MRQVTMNRRPLASVSYFAFMQVRYAGRNDRTPGATPVRQTD